MLVFVGLMKTIHFKCFMRSFDRAESSLSKRYTSFCSISDWLNAIDIMLVCRKKTVILADRNTLLHSNLGWYRLLYALNWYQTYCLFIHQENFHAWPTFIGHFIDIQFDGRNHVHFVQFICLLLPVLNQTLLILLRNSGWWANNTAHPIINGVKCYWAIQTSSSTHVCVHLHAYLYAFIRQTIESRNCRFGQAISFLQSPPHIEKKNLSTYIYRRVLTHTRAYRYRWRLAFVKCNKRRSWLLSVSIYDLSLAERERVYMSGMADGYCLSTLFISFKY